MAHLKFPFLLKLEIQQNWNFTTWHLYVLQNQEISKTGNALPHGISGVAVLLDQHIATNCLIHAQFYSFKDSTKRINNLKAFSSVKSEIQQNTNCLLQCPGFLAQFSES